MKKPIIKLYEYQKRWHADTSQFKIAMVARQCGKTSFMSTLEVVRDCFKVEAKGKKTKWVILSRGERQAREAMLEGVIPHVKAHNAAAECIESGYIGEDKTEYKQLEVVLPRGSRIIALPANPDTARGYSANVLLDEFARHVDSRKIWMALYPVISAGYMIRVVSTPNGKGNKFYELMTDQSGIWSKHVVNIRQAVADGLPRDIEMLKKGLADEDAWRQEYLLEWLDEASAWLDFDLINSCEHDLAGKPDLYQGYPVFIGNDIAVRNDKWVVHVYEPIGDVLWLREKIVKQRISFTEQDAILDDVFKRYRVARLCMDQTGIGEKPVEDAKHRYGNSRVEGVMFTPHNKLVMATIGKQAFEDRKVRIPAGDFQLRTDLHSLQKTVSPTGQPRFVADRDKNGHADEAWACFLALNAAATPSSVYEYTPVGTRHFARQYGFRGCGI